MSQTNFKHIVSMLVQETKIMLFTETGEVLDMKVDGPYDTAKISEYLGSQLNGTNKVSIDLNEYMTFNKALQVPEGEPITITTIIDGKEVQGIFYPQKVAVAVEHEGEQVTIPNVENLTRHIQRAADTNSPSVRNFLRRIAPVAKERRHSAEDLMAFIQKSDLPLTNDGKIIGYKKVNKVDDEYFVDVHSGKVRQRLGSRVWMEADKVDPNRRNSCSNGLHVANLGYLSGFGGDHVLIVLVDPADFIAVPHGETTKARVCSYDVIGVMAARSKQIVDSGKHVVGDPTLQKIIASAIEGTYVKPFEKIQVGNKEVLKVEAIRVTDTGNEIVYEAANEQTVTDTKSLEDDLPEKSKDLIKTARTTKAAQTGKTLWDNAPKEVIKAFKDLKAEKLSKTAIAEKYNTSTRTIGRWMEKYGYDAWLEAQETPVETPIQTTVAPPAIVDEPVVTPEPETKPMTVSEQARALFNDGKFTELAAFKKAKKKSYYALGFTQKEEEKILKSAA